MERSRCKGGYNEAVALKIPSALAASCRQTPERTRWLKHLPSLVEKLKHLWGFEWDGPLSGEEPSCSYVAAVLCRDGTSAVLKIALPHMEGEHEVHGLRFWDGDATVRLLAADENLGALLLERCRPGTTLRTLSEFDQDLVVSRLLRRLWRPPLTPHPFRSLSSLTEYWTHETLAQAEYWLDSALVEEGLGLFKDLPRNATREVLLATDLHSGNVLRAEREPWLVIDAKPFVGDPAYDATQHLFNCRARLQADPERTIRSFSDLLGVEHERVRLWTFARLAAEPRLDWNNVDLALARSISP